VVQGVGFEPTKLYAPELKSGPFDQLGYPCEVSEDLIRLETSGFTPPLGGVQKTMQIALGLHERFNTPPSAGRR
tara:strand:+ start:324 stop:545 length:222 start_codon:yes stop_codon:yes gene_type:complete